MNPLTLLFALLWMFGIGRRMPDLTTRAPAPAPPPAPPRPAPQAPVSVPTPSPMPQSIPVPSPAPAATPASYSTPAPWPQSVPSGLPPFPSGWEPDEPVGAGVAARAAQLLPELWAHGAGTRKTEQTGGRWITYLATQMGSKRGVTAWRLKPGATPASPAATPTVSPASPVALRTLRVGSTGPDVQLLQARLGVDADGKFGPGTRAAVMAYQRSHGLQVDGIVGRNTWASLMGTQRA